MAETRRRAWFGCALGVPRPPSYGVNRCAGPGSRPCSRNRGGDREGSRLRRVHHGVHARR